MSHRIAAVHYPPGASDGPCDCTCSWSGLASQFATHRRVHGLTDRQLRALPEYDMTPAFCRRSRQRGTAARLRGKR